MVKYGFESRCVCWSGGEGRYVQKGGDDGAEAGGGVSGGGHEANGSVEGTWRGRGAGERAGDGREGSEELRKEEAHWLVEKKVGGDAR